MITVAFHCTREGHRADSALHLDAHLGDRRGGRLVALLLDRIQHVRLHAGPLACPSCGAVKRRHQD
jgi:hypothetical protein